MTADIQPYRDAPLDTSLGPVGMRPDFTEKSPAISIAAVLRRRWLMILSLSLLIVLPSTLCVWLFINPTYAATAQMQVAPSRDPILYADDPRSQIIPFFDAYLNTQVQRISSGPVLTAALSDPNVQGLALLETPNPENTLRRMLKVEKVFGSHLIQIEVTSDDRGEAVRLAKALVNAYMVRVVEDEAVQERKRLVLLEKKRDQYESRLNQRQDELRKLAEEYGTATESTFELLREGILQSTLDTKRELANAEAEVIRHGEHLKELDDEARSEMLSQDDIAYQEQAAENDPIVRSLREKLMAVSVRLLQLQSTLTEDHEAVIRDHEEKARLKKQLEKELARAAQDARAEILSRRVRMMEATKADAARALRGAERRYARLVAKVTEEEEQGMAIGRHGLEIEALQEQVEKLKEQCAYVMEKIRREEIEHYRPPRVTLTSPATVLPGGTRDKRLKLTVVVVMGAVFLAISAALLKDRWNSHLYAPQEVESRTGLRVLGAVPCLRELGSGQATKEDFLESYRLVITTLSSFGPDATSPPQSILITSAQAAEGKTSLAVSLAASLAEPGSRVLLVDSDLQAPQIERLLKLTPPGTLEAVLLGNGTLPECVERSRLAGVDVLVSSPNGVSASRIFNMRSAARFLQEAAELYDHIVVDSSPALSSASTLVWARAVDGVIVSSLADQTNTQAMKLACDRLRSIGANLLGAVIGNVSKKEAFYSYSAVRSQEEPSSGYGVRRAGKQYGPLVIQQLPNDEIPSDEESA